MTTDDLKQKLINAYIATRTPAAMRTPDWARVRRSLECELFAKSLDMIVADFVRGSPADVVSA